MEEEDEAPKFERIEGAMQHEYDMTYDPSTQSVPRNRLLKAQQFAELKRQQRDAIPNIEWQERGPNNVAGRTRSILIDKNDPSGETVWVGSVGGGIWKTTNISNADDPQWVTVDDFFENIAISAIAQDPIDPSIMYFGTGEGWFNGDAIRGLGIWQSTDGGLSWSQLSSTNNSTFHYTQKLIINDQQQLFACTRNRGIMRSDDFGQTWVQVLANARFGITNRAADLELAANGTLFAAMGIFSEDGIYKSTDNGDTWERLTDGLPTDDFQRIEIALAPSDTNRIYALLQSDSTRQCLGIWRSDDGNSFVEVANPSAFGMSNFARNQAWYDLIARVDPNDPDRLFIGGVDLLLSDDAGESWEQISQWFGGFGLQYVHADQHAIEFSNGSSDTILFANDGGIFKTDNGSADVPDITDRNFGYNVTQYYACAIHPGEGVTSFLAGAQDNGTQQYSEPDIGGTIEVTGGDGAFCHYDQINPDTQITAFTYGSYNITTDNWATRDFVRVGDRGGRFINPSDYDSENKILYAAYSGGQYTMIEDIGGSNFPDTIEIAEFGNRRASYVLVSPNDPSTVYFGLDNANLVKLTGANSSSPQATIIRNDPQSKFMSSIDVERGNEDHIIVTYSNYGVTSIYETLDGGQNWQAVEGDLPDIPVRSVLFAPDNADQALIGTELGVWTTDDLDGNNTSWGPSNIGFANVRVDMLQIRPSDFTIIAATHGRGLYSTNHFSPEKISFMNSTGSASESADIFINDCNALSEFRIPVTINKSPTNAVEVAITIDPTSTAEQFTDFNLVTNAITFLPNGTLTEEIVIEIIDDYQRESDPETVIIQLDADDANGLDTTFTLTILDNELVPFTAQSELVEVGDGDREIEQGPFGGFFEDGRAQLLFTAAELQSASIKAGSITSLSFELVDINSDLIYSDFTVKMATTTQTELDNDFVTINSINFIDDVILSELGWINLEFDQPFNWDGTSNLIVETCFNNSAFSRDDEVAGTQTNFNSFMTAQVDDADGCTLIADNTSTIRPNVRFGQERSTVIATSLSDSSQARTNPTEIVHFYSAEERLIASVEQVNDVSTECIDVSIVREGNDRSSPAWLMEDLTDKIFRVNAETEDLDYMLTVYFTREELLAWGADTLTLNAISSPSSLLTTDGTDVLSIANDTITVQYYEEEAAFGYTFKGSGTAEYALTDFKFIPVNVNEIEDQIEFSIWPNPVSDQMTLRYMAQESSNYSIGLYDVNGRMIRTIEPNGINNLIRTESIKNWGLSSGLYYVRLNRADGASLVRKLVVQ